MLGLDGLDAADSGRDDAPDPHRVIRQLAVPAGLFQRLVGGDERELREPVEPADLLDRQEVLGLEVGAGAGAVDDSALAGRPPLVQRLCADPERRDGPEAGDHDSATS